MEHRAPQEGSAMTESVDNLILDLVEWVEGQPRTYVETMEAWRTSCPRLPIWEEAKERGFIKTDFTEGRSMVRATQAGLRFLQERRPQTYTELQHRSIS